MKIILLHSVSGGSGVTTVTANLSAALQNLGHRCLAIDCAPENVLALHFGVATDTIAGWATSTRASQSWSDSGFEASDGSRVLPFGMLTEAALTQLADTLKKQPDYLAAICQALHGQPLDFLLLDLASPITGCFSNQLCALQKIADFSLLIARADTQTYRLLVSHPLYSQRLMDSKLLLNSVKTENELQKDLLLVMRHEFEHCLAPNVIHYDASVPEAFAHLQALKAYAPESAAALDFHLLALWCTNQLRQATE
ncbi:MAG: cellulose biosynthesis protein BcsQ [Zhongshania sp.]|uniref:cellulose biosynthesis protein BcsQ n=1 Tax=Zhongshania sp. TaxID=1971902 RepID=UPI00261D72EA|nr:cellulose biosynthesis protein BcsQ [Zhongshania sp.]MDF1693786.1 cellulose biosynthesis protein BcsQ [Zhongshania sp.]